MADPVTATLAGTALVGSLVGGIGGGIAQQQSASYQAAVARNNRVIAQQAAQSAASAGDQRARNIDIRTAQLVGGEKAAQGASGVSTESPTSLVVRTSTAQTGRLDASTIMQQAGLEAGAKAAEATGFGEQAALEQRTADLAIPASLIGTASSFADKWNSYQLKGVKPFGVDLGSAVA